jgi:hypothetical protein
LKYFLKLNQNEKIFYIFVPMMVIKRIKQSIQKSNSLNYNMIKKNILAAIVLFLQCTFISAQDSDNSYKDTDLGISVSPSNLRFNAKPGAIQTKTIKISNETNKKISFQVSFQDYGMDAKGNQDVSVSSEYRNALSKYIVVSPTFIELKPKEIKVVTVTVDIPPGDQYAIALWTTLILDQVVDRPKLEVNNPSNNTMAMGINTSIGFGVNIYQNPPNVVVNSVEIVSMRYQKATEKKGNLLIMKAKNTGDGIGYCLYYLELTNLLTGKQTKLKVKQFSLFPGYQKEFDFELPKELEKGKYSALAVLDFGNKEELRTAELEFVAD